MRLALSIAALAMTSGTALLFACGSDDPSIGGPAGPGPAGSSSGASGQPGAAPAPPIPRERFAEAIIGAYCDSVAPCCQAQGLGYDANACRAVLSGSDGGTGTTQMPLLQALDPAKSQLVYDPQAAGDCVATIRGIGKICETPSSTDPLAMARNLTVTTEGSTACFRMLSGTKKLGEPCTFGECALPANPKAWVLCSPAEERDAGGPPPPAVCHELVMVDTPNAPCSTDLSLGISVSLCAGTRLTKIPDGLTLDQLTQDALACDAKSKTCQWGRDVYRATGQPCGEGEPCLPSADCSRTTGRCEPRIEPGQACAVGSGTVGCVRHATCKDGTCVALKNDGEPCTSNSECLGDCGERKVCEPRAARLANPRLCEGR